MHFADGQVPREYIGYVHFKIGFMCLAFIGLALGLAFSISIGAAGVPFAYSAQTDQPFRRILTTRSVLL